MAQTTLDESHAEFLGLAPDDTAIARDIFGLDHELEPIAPDQGAIDVNARAAFGKIANKAIDTDAALEIDPAALVGTQPVLVTMFVHDRARAKLGIYALGLTRK